jgi:hypothetical protein
MRKETDKFYRKLKFDGVDYAPGDDEIPITFTHIFKKSYPRLPQVSLPNPRAGNLNMVLKHFLFHILRQDILAKIFFYLLQKMELGHAH